MIPPRAVCPWCEEPISFDEDWHLHEALRKRGQLHPSMQSLIFVVENCVPLHEECHLEHGQTYEMKQKCLDVLIKNVGAEKIRIWYLDLRYQLGLGPHRGSSAAEDDADWLRQIFL